VAWDLPDGLSFLGKSLKTLPAHVPGASQVSRAAETVPRTGLRALSESSHTGEGVKEEEEGYEFA
jgi:hypothetical protein